MAAFNTGSGNVIYTLTTTFLHTFLLNYGLGVEYAFGSNPG